MNPFSSCTKKSCNSHCENSSSKLNSGILLFYKNTDYVHSMLYHYLWLKYCCYLLGVFVKKYCTLRYTIATISFGRKVEIKVYVFIYYLYLIYFLSISYLYLIHILSIYYLYLIYILSISNLYLNYFLLIIWSKVSHTNHHFLRCCIENPGAESDF